MKLAVRRRPWTEAELCLTHPFSKGAVSTVDIPAAGADYLQTYRTVLIRPQWPVRSLCVRIESGMASTAFVTQLTETALVSPRLVVYHYGISPQVLRKLGARPQ